MIRRSRPPKSFNLTELLEWVTFDRDAATRNFVSREEEMLARLADGGVSNWEQSRAARAILRALRDGDIVGHANVSAEFEHIYNETGEVIRQEWKNYSDQASSVPEHAWGLGNVDWDNSTLLYSEIFYANIRVPTKEVLALWPPSNLDAWPFEDALPAVIPAAGRTVTLDHNSSDYQRAVNSLDKIVAEFSKDHRFDNEWRNEKNALLGVIEEGRKYLNQTVVDVGVAWTLTVEPLSRLNEKYKDAVGAGLVVELIVRLIETLSKLLGII